MKIHEAREAVKNQQHVDGEVKQGWLVSGNVIGFATDKGLDPDPHCNATSKGSTRYPKKLVIEPDRSIPERLQVALPAMRGKFVIRFDALRSSPPVPNADELSNVR